MSAVRITLGAQQARTAAAYLDADADVCEDRRDGALLKAVARKLREASE